MKTGSIKQLRQRDPGRRAFASWAACGLLLSAAIPAQVQAEDAQAALSPSGEYSVYETEAAQTPPMGWNPWNAFRTDVDEEKIRGSAEALVNNGLAQLGYRYVNIDDGWALQRRDDGSLKIRETMFPSAEVDGHPNGSFVPFTDFIHSLGLKAGLYTDIGRNTCAQRWDATSPNLPVGSIAERQVGSMDHAEQDMKTIFGTWGFDYVKIDACGVADYARDVEPVQSGRFNVFPPYIVRGDIPNSDPDAVEALYADLGTAIKEWGGDDAVLSICAWGEALSPRWGNKRGNLWRTSPDIEFHWDSMLRNIESAVDRTLYAGPGHWNDPDMLAIGHGDFDENHLTEARAHMSMWAIMASPLLIGYDLRDAPQPLLDILGNREVIAIDQDAAGNQGVPYRQGEAMVVVRTLSGDGARAVAFFNRGEEPVSATVDWTQLGFAPGSEASVRDVWSHENLAAAKDAISVDLGAHEARLFRLKGTPEDADAVWLDEMPGRINVAVDGIGNHSLSEGWVPARVAVAPDGSAFVSEGTRFAKGIGLFANSRVEIRTESEFDEFDASPLVLNGSGPVRFLVYADRKLVAETTVEAGAAGEISADISAAQVVELVAIASSVSGERPPMIAWADAKLQR